MKNENIWLAAYLYYAEPWEHLLTDAVMPFVYRAFEKKWVEQFFFLRYWERGPHIRLRFNGKKQKLEEELRPEIQTFFSNYFQRYPSNRNDSESRKKLPPNQQWYQNNSIQYINYEPEINRYGGLTGMSIAEEHFESSSRTVLQIIDESPDWNYDRALGSAIQMHLGFAFSLGMDLTETKEFYSRYYKDGFKYAYSHNETLTPEELTNRKAETLNAFVENYEKQKSTLLSFLKILWDALEKKTTFEQNWFNQWLADVRITGQKLINAQTNNNLIIPTRFKIDSKIKIPETRQMLWSIYRSYVHMNNNRLGILNWDEAYLGYLLNQCLKNM